MTAEMVVLDRAGRILHANEAWANGTGAGMPQSGYGASYFDCWAGVDGSAADAAVLENGIRSVLEGRGSEFRMERTRDAGSAGGWRRVLVAASALVTQGGGAIVLHTALSAGRSNEEELQLAKQAAEAADHAKSAFLASMSHELRTPLNSIIGFSQLLEDGTGGALTERQHKYATNILTSGRQLLDLIDNVLELTKVEAAHLTLQVSLFDVAAMLRDLHTLVLRLAERKRLTLTMEAADDLLPVTADRPKLKQVLFSLLSNAIKFTADGGTVRVHASRLAPGPGRVGEWFELSVSDTGSGIAADQIERLFDPFARGAPQAEAGSERPGMGLVLARRLVELHGGRMYVESQMGQGTTVRVQLPAASRQAQDAAGAARPGGAVVGKTTGPLVLVVEDDRQASDLLGDYLGTAGYAVARAYSGEQALRLVQELQPAAITLDLLLPDRDGLELLALLKSLPDTREIPVIVISVTERRDVALELGALAWLVKPVQRGMLLEVLDRGLQSAAAPGGGG